MDHGSTEWKNGLLEVVLAMNTQIHSTIGCAPAELLFRDRSSHINWLNSQARKDLTVGVEQEDPAMGLIFESDLQSEVELEALIDPRLQREPEPDQSESSILGYKLELEFELEQGSDLELELELKPELRLKPSSELSSLGLNSEPSSSSEPEPELEQELGIELSGSGLNSEPTSGSEPEPE
ncbi:hypothetical protein VE03_10914 [Pseudogymnoascus sp. 23342-1-I1]|nr:hypothetical protein VE03_10914 [Pseudogymnoascus sp. 23342-1-I1]